MTNFFDKNGVIWTIVVIGVLFCGICLGLLINGQGYFLPSLSGFAAAFGTLLLGIAAIKGVNQWKAEIRGRTEFEAAKNFLLSAYKLKKELTACRHPMVSSGEFPDGYEPLKLDPQYRAEAYAHVYNNRWRYVSNSIIEFDAASLEAEVLWGKQASQLSINLRKCAARLRASIDSYVRDMAANGAHFRSNPEFRRKVEQDIFYPGLEEENELELLLSRAIDSIENFAKKHLPRSE